jgi:hypothetical protein
VKLLAVAMLLLLLAAFAFGQDDCDHTSNAASRFEEVRLLPPVRIRYFDPARIEYTHEDKHGIHVGSLTADGETIMPEKIWQEYKKKYYWILY